MRAALQSLAEEYRGVMRDYLSGGGEGALARAGELGQRADAAGFSILDMIWVHHRTVEGLGRISFLRRKKFAKAEEVLAKAMSAFESSRLGNHKLLEGAFQKVQEELEKRVRDRMIQISRANEELRTEVTERARAEEALRANADNLKSLFDAMSEGIVISERGMIMDVNKAYTEIVRCERSAIIGRPVLDFIAEESKDLVRANLLSGYDRPYECVGLRIDGTNVFLEVTGKPYVYNGRKARVASVRDIGARKDTEETLRRSEERFRQLAENIREVFWLITPFADKVFYVSPAYEHIWQRSCESLYANPGSWMDTVHPDDRERIAREVRTMQPFMPWTKEYRIVRPDGSIRRCRDQFFPVRDEDGSIYRLAGVTEDVTERKQAEEERQKMGLELLRAQKLQAVGRLAAGIAHEINTPMQFIGDNTHFLRDAYGRLLRLLETCARLRDAGKDAPQELLRAVELAIQEADMDYLRVEIPRSLQQSLEGIEHVAKIVRAMKEFAYPVVEERVEVDLNRVVESAVTVSHNEWKYVADLVKELDPDLPPVSCLAGEINQVLLNIIVNAAQAIAEKVGDGSNGKGTITVRTRREGEFAEIRITDTGPGIPDHLRENIFEPFFTTKDIGKGTGQGLAMSRTVVVDKHRGTISFETAAGGGTTFVIRLPMHAPENK